MTILGQNIRYLRQRARQSRREFAAPIGASKYFISDIEIGPEKRKSQLRRKLAAHLGYDLDYISTFSIIPDRKRVIQTSRARADKIEQRLIDYGHCVSTKNKFALLL